METLVLYYSPYCPFCQKVLRFMEQNDISIDMKSTLENENLDYLIRVGGKNQVPCLMIDGKALYESDDIIAYLGKRFGKN
ncbi:MAG TPA: glutaredoxin [Coriobacteriia bacterium]|nr:glutaredoxin [Coriobacteriia bacterium]